MAILPLTKGKFAIVDDEDFELLSQWKWCVTGSGYAMRAQRCGGGKSITFLMHRVINQTPDGMHTDHINGDPLDNRRANLRTVTAQQNMWNKRTSRKVSSSQYKGVGYCKQTGKWRASIEANGKYIALGRFEAEEDAATVYNFAAEKYHGQYAQFNVTGG